jgi:hypothetical protein
MALNVNASRGWVTSFVLMTVAGGVLLCTAIASPPFVEATS